MPSTPKTLFVSSTWEYSDWAAGKAFALSEPGREFFLLSPESEGLWNPFIFVMFYWLESSIGTQGKRGLWERLTPGLGLLGFATTQTSLAFWNHVHASIVFSWASTVRFVSFLTFYIQSDIWLHRIRLVSFCFAENVFPV